MKKWLTMLAFLFMAATSLAADTQFIRVTKDQDGVPLTVETATVRYTNKDTTIDLISVIHIADRRYYMNLDTQFRQYDAVLYELVAPKGTTPEKKGGINLHTIISLFLQLDSQLECINYDAKNFVHADLSGDELIAAIQKRGHDPYTIALGLLVDMLRQNNLQKNKPAIDSRKLEHKDTAVYVKRMFALSLENSDVGQTLGTLLIDDRNQTCIDVLKSQLTDGRKKIGIFYGAAHMPDFETRLRNMGYQKTDTTWWRAWDIKPKTNAIDMINKIR